MSKFLENALQRLRVRVANSLARAVVQVINDDAKIQILQLGVLDGEDVDDCERLQNYGFTSRPHEGAEAAVMFIDGDRAHPIVVAVDDRRHRPTGLADGEVATYNSFGAKVHLKDDGSTEVTGGGTAVRLATLEELNALADVVASHIHVTTATVGATATPGLIQPTESPVPTATGTTKFKAE